MKKAVIILPTYNEAENISKIIPEIFSIVEKINNWDTSILVVDDSSPDGTADEVRKMQKKYPKIQQHIPVLILYQKYKPALKKQENQKHHSHLYD
jgi:glycosyltransferase involved in cell wall biosynthesis